MAGDGLDGLQEIGRFALAPRGQRAVIDLQVLVGHHQAFVKEELRPKTIAFRAGAEGRVEGKQPRLDLGDGEAANRAGEVFAEGDALGLGVLHGGFEDGDPVGQIKRGAETVGQAGLHAPA